MLHLNMLRKALEETRKMKEQGANASELLQYLHLNFPILDDREIWWIMDQILKAA